ncbi:hypothetical protein ML462_02170 [Gramella lutea]|uniref:DUF748 domain-containing protein n=1 Tax=Christiangramia lutea TaxID=1607951 RepID=A0A9X2A9D6_9FLAO|nr:hypothetical protein [Christiangramia lutea]MCH4821966.1 hypothetical protein [Christiangramia lutea]
MNKTTKLTIGILSALAVAAIALIILNNYLENRITKALEDNLKGTNAVYDKVDVNLLSRKAEIIKPFVEIKDKTLKVDAISLNDIHLWDYISNKDIVIGELKISNPVVKFYNSDRNSKDTLKSSENKKSSKFQNKVLVKRVSVEQGSFQIFENDSSEHRLFTKINSINLEQVRINSETLKESIPFNYELILLKADSLFYDLDKQHELAVGDLEIDNNKVKITEFQIIPKYSRAGHQETIKVEKDRYELAIDSILMNDLNWGVQNDSLKFENPVTRIKNADFRIYRSKLPPDDTGFKPMYSEMIRKMPILLELDSIQISNSYIKYEEQVQADRVPGMVEFSNLNISMSNLTNIGLDRNDFPKTRVKANTDFMKTSPLEIDWEFDISNREDRFQITGSLGALAASEMNRFLKAGMNVEASGEISSMYFNFYGNANQAQGEMRLDYNDFKVEVLRKDREKKNKIISALANLIVRNDTENRKVHYKEIKYTRDETRSFWNYLWNLIKNGALKSFL